MTVHSSSEMPNKSPKGLFWLILSCLSVLFAEVVSGSHPWGVFSIWGIIAVLPLYGLHAIILMALSHRHGTPRISALVAAGAVFGLYEAYITKVIWNPTFPTPGIKLAGLDVMSLFGVSLAFHPLMSFVVPVAVADMLCLHTGQWRLWTPSKLRRALLDPKRAMRAVALLGAFAGLFNGCTLPPGSSHIMPAMMMMLNSGLIALLVWAWNRRIGGTLPTLVDVLPNCKQLLQLSFALLAVFLLQGCLLRLNALPGLRNQVGVWLLYALFIWLFWRGSRKEAVCKPPRRKHVLFSKAPLACFIFGLSMASCTIIGDFMPIPLKGLYLVVGTVWIISWSLWIDYKAFKLARGITHIG